MGGPFVWLLSGGWQAEQGWWGCRKLRNPSQTGVSNSGMWLLTSLLLFLTIWGISSTPVNPGKATPLLPAPPQDPRGGGRGAFTPSTTSSEPQGERQAELAVGTQQQPPWLEGRCCINGREPGVMGIAFSSTLGSVSQKPLDLPALPVTPSTVKAPGPSQATPEPHSPKWLVLLKLCPNSSPGSRS